jgi:hypothetical protein
MRFNKTLFIFIVASLIAHAVFLALCFLAPKSEPQAVGVLGDCVEPTIDRSGSSTANANTNTGSDYASAGVAGVAIGSSPMGGGVALGPKVTIRTEAVFWPCCGPGCPSKIAAPKSID